MDHRGTLEVKGVGGIDGCHDNHTYGCTAGGSLRSQLDGMGDVSVYMEGVNMLEI